MKPQDGSGHHDPPNTDTDPDRASSSIRNISVGIVGMGLAGVALAIGLKHQGIHFHLYEAAPALHELSAGVAFSPTAIQALQLIDDRLIKAYVLCATSNLDTRISTGIWGTVRYGMDSKSPKYSKRIGDYICDIDWCLHEDSGSEKVPLPGNVHRANFLNEAGKILPDDTKSFSKTLVSLDEEVNGVKLYFEDGTTAVHDAVIGCDGIRSKTRRLLLGEDHPAASPQFTGEYAYRTLVPQQKAIEILGEDLASNAQLYAGYGGFWITYPVDHGNALNVLLIKQSGQEDWPYEKWVVPSSAQEIVNDFKDWDPKILDLATSFEAKEKWAFFDVPLTASYARGCICVLGDAAHAMHPGLASGAGLAFEDAFVMSQLLGSVKQSKHIPSALEAFDRVRRPRTSRAVSESRKVGLSNEFLHPDIGDDFEKYKSYVLERMKWVWGIDVRPMAQEALQLFEQMLLERQAQLG